MRDFSGTMALQDRLRPPIIPSRQLGPMLQPTFGTQSFGFDIELQQHLLPVKHRTQFCGRTNQVQTRQPTIAQLEQAAATGNQNARLELGNHLLTRYPAESPESRRGLSLLEQLAQGSQAPTAQWLLGEFYTNNLTLPGAVARARDWMELAAASGVAPALDRLANLCLMGDGDRFQPEKTLALLERLAAAGYRRAAWEVGYLKSTLEQIEDARGAATAFARACALNFVPAYYSLGLRFAVGAGVDPDPAFARALLQCAADAEVRDARDAANELVPADKAGPDAEVWYTELKRNRAGAAVLLNRLGNSGPMLSPRQPGLVAEIESHFASLDHPALTTDESGKLVVRGSGRAQFRACPAKWDWLCEHPRVATSSGFVTREECAQLLSMVSGAMVSSEVYAGKDSKSLIETRLFSGTGMYFSGMTSDTIVRCIERRIASHTNWRVDAVEPCSIIAYKPGQEYRPHVDFFTREQLEEQRAGNRDRGGQRVVTFLICIHAADMGGDTYYPHADLTVAHRVGSAMMHYNSEADGLPDEASLHQGLAVERGEKWLLRTTLRTASLYPD